AAHAPADRHPLQGDPGRGAGGDHAYRDARQPGGPPPAARRPGSGGGGRRGGGRDGLRTGLAHVPLLFAGSARPLVAGASGVTGGSAGAGPRPSRACPTARVLRRVTPPGRMRFTRPRGVPVPRVPVPQMPVPEVPVPQVPGQGVPDAPAPAPAAAAPSRSGAPSRPPDPSGVSFTRTRGTRLPTRVTISYAIVPAACAQSWAVGSPRSPGPKSTTSA